MHRYYISVLNFTIAIITHLAQPFCYSFFSAAPTLNPAYMTSIVGSTVRFFCTSKKEKEWTFNDQQLPQNIAINGRLQEYIIISNLQLSNDGVYKCITKDYYDMEYVAEGRLVVVRKDHNDSEYYTTLGSLIGFGEI